MHSSPNPDIQYIFPTYALHSREAWPLSSVRVLQPRSHSGTVRPMQAISNKDVEVADLDRLFEEYVEMDLLHPFNNSASGQSSSDELARLFELASSNESDLFRANPILDRETKAAWHKALQDCDENLTSPWSDVSTSSSFSASSSTGKESPSDSASLSFPAVVELDRDQLQSASQPSTPRPHTSGRLFKKAVSFHSQFQHCGIKKPSKKSSTRSSSKMMQSTHPRFYTPDFWSRKTETPIGCLARNSCASYTASPRPVQQEQDHDFLIQEYQQSRTHTHSLLPSHSGNVSHHHSTSLMSAAIGTCSVNGYNENMHLEYGSCNASSAGLPALPTPPSSLPLAAEPWCPDTSCTLDFDLTASTDFIDTTKASNWWNTSVPSTQPCYSIESPLHFTSQALDVPGLGITSATTSFDFGVVNAHTLASSASSSSFNMPSYTPMQPPPHHRPSSPQSQPRTHPRRKPGSRSRRPSQRRKSTCSTNSASTATASVGFVNFTPEDSRKILTGVAPSGSSKTKARREKEAADRRRRFNQMAVQAVMAVGGNLDMIRSLERDGLLVS